MLLDQRLRLYTLSERIKKGNRLMEVLVGCHDGRGNMGLEQVLCAGLTSKEENESEVGVPEGWE